MKRFVLFFAFFSVLAGPSAFAAPVAMEIPIPAVAPSFHPCTPQGYGPAFAAADDEFDLGQAAADAGRHQEAIEHFNKAIALNPNDACAYNNLGVEQEAVGQPDQAMQSYDKAITLDPTLANAWENRGNLYLDRGDADRADIDYAHADLADELHAEI